jgi:hypothetical protein
MHALIYKQTHLNDPGHTGVFGVNDCTGRVRDRDYDCVIALCGNELSWVGLHAKKVPWPGYSPQVVFKNFVSLLPSTHIVRPALYEFMRGGERAARVYPIQATATDRLNMEIRTSLKLAVSAPPSRGGQPSGGKCEAQRVLTRITIEFYLKLTTFA